MSYKHKRSDVPGKVPVAADFNEGEILVNTADGRAFINTPGGVETLPNKNDVSVLAGFRNKIINGCAEIAQRGTSFAVAPGQTAYTADRWRIYNNTNQTLNVQCPALMSFAGSSKHPRLRLAFATAPTTGNVFVTQRIEGADTLAGRKVTMSFAHAAGEVITGSCYLGQNFGTGGSVSVGTATQTALLRNDGGIGIAKLVFDLPSTEEKIFGPSDFLEWVVSLPVRTTQPLTITRMSLVEGDATAEEDPFSPRHIQQELALCERYYETGHVVRAAPYVRPGGAPADANCFATVQFRTIKRAIPSMSGTAVYAALNTWNDISFSSASAYLTANNGTGEAKVASWSADAEL